MFHIISDGSCDLGTERAKKYNIDKVKVYDQNVSKLADFNYTTYNYNDLRQAILDKIVKSSIEIKNICKDCCWINICEEIRKKMK